MRVKVEVGNREAWKGRVRRILWMLEADKDAAPYCAPAYGYKVGRTEDERRGRIDEVNPTMSAALSAGERRTEGYDPHSLEGRCMRQVRKAAAVLGGRGLYYREEDIERIVAFFEETRHEFLRYEDRISWMDPRTGVCEVETTAAEDLWSPPEPERKPKRRRATDKLSESDRRLIRDTFEAVCAGFKARKRIGYKMEAYRLTAAEHGISWETVRKVVKAGA